MITVAIVYRVDFDELENNIYAARCRSLSAVFAGREGGAVYADMEQYRADRNADPTYQGWDGVTYPRYEVEVFEANESEYA